MEVDVVDMSVKDKSSLVVYDMARALLQIYQGIEAKYLNPPLGKSIR